MARKREDDPLLSLHFEHLMSRLFGDSRFRGSAGYYWPSAWRDDLPRIFDALREAVHVNVRGDNAHRAELERECQRAIGDLKRLKSDDQITLAAVYRLTRISFMLLGSLPDHSRISKYRRPCWVLRRHRSFSYVRSSHQRVAQLLDMGDKGLKERGLPDRLKLQIKISKTFSRDPVAFLDWLRENHPRVYSELD